MKILWHQENMPHMNVRKNKGVTYLTWPEFEKIPGFVHGFSTRLGGVSEGIYSSMNLSFTRGDKEEAVRENYNRISAALGFSPEDIVTSDQTHTANVRVITAEDRGNGITKAPSLHGCRRNDNQCAGPCTGNLLCGLCASLFCRSCP